MAEAEEPSEEADAMMATCPIVVSPFDVDASQSVDADDTVVADGPYVGDDGAADVPDGGPRSRVTIPVPPPPSFFPSNTGRIRPVTGPVVRVAAASPTVPASPTPGEDVDTGERVRVERSSRVIHVGHASAGRPAVAYDGNPPTAAAMPSVASDGAVRVVKAPRMRWSSQYRVLHPDD